MCIDDDDTPVEPGKGFRFVDEDEDIEVGDQILLPSEPLDQETIDEIRDDNDDPDWEPVDMQEWVEVTEKNKDDILPSYGELPPIRRQMTDEEIERWIEDEDD